MRRFSSAEWAVVAFTLLYMGAALAASFAVRNREFVFYFVVMCVLIAAIGTLHTRVRLHVGALWGLSAWGLAHMAGGLMPVPESWPIRGDARVLYNWWIVPGAIKYDQLVHAYGFGLVTWICWQSLRSAFGTRGAAVRPTIGLLTLCVVGGMGFGAANEVVEFIATLTLPGTNVGGYENTGWDLVSNLVGCLLAAAAIAFRDRVAATGTAADAAGIGAITPGGASSRDREGAIRSDADRRAATSCIKARDDADGRVLDDRIEEAKLEAMAEFAAGAGHEINNPVATIAGRAQMLLDGETHPERRHALAVIGGQALRIRDMIGDAMLFARPPRPDPQPLDLAAVVDEELPSLRETVAARGAKLTVDCSAAPILADRAQLAIVLHALVRNAAEAVTGGTVRIAVARGDLAGRPAATLTVSDDGPGLSEQDRRHLFDPFYSGRQAGRGLGFGLPKCWRIVRLHGGTIDVQSSRAGTELLVTWPAAE